jgi:hypothetical protein
LPPTSCKIRCRDRSEGNPGPLRGADPIAASPWQRGVACGIPYYGIEPRVKRTDGETVRMLAAGHRHSQGIDTSLSAAVAGYVVVTLGCSIAFWVRFLSVGGARDLAWQCSEGACRVLR